MAHIGKIYERHFHRDMSFRTANGMNYLPKRLYFENFQLFPPTGKIWPSTRCYSDPGETDLDTGITTYQMIPPPGASAGLAVRFEHRLLFTIDFVEHRAYMSDGGVDLWYLKHIGGSPFIGSYTASGFFTVLTALQPPQPTGASNFHRVRWSGD